jgi:hypothetical protein
MGQKCICGNGKRHVIFRSDLPIKMDGGCWCASGCVHIVPDRHPRLTGCVQLRFLSIGSSYVCPISIVRFLSTLSIFGSSSGINGRVEFRKFQIKKNHLNHDEQMFWPSTDFSNPKMCFVGVTCINGRCPRRYWAISPSDKSSIDLHR